MHKLWHTYLTRVILLKTRIMDEKTADIRKEYTQKALMESGIEADPVRQFNMWWHEALEAKIIEVNAMTLATCFSRRNAFGKNGVNERVFRKRIYFFYKL